MGSQDMTYTMRPSVIVYGWVLFKLAVGCVRLISFKHISVLHVMCLSGAWYM
jgi:hypothetical protein